MSLRGVDNRPVDRTQRRSDEPPVRDRSRLVGQLGGRDLRRQQLAGVRLRPERTVKAQPKPLAQRQLTKAQKSARKTAVRGMNGLLSELSRPEGKVNPSKVAERLSQLNAAANAYVAATQGASKESVLKQWFNEGFASQRAERRQHFVANAASNAGKAAASRADGVRGFVTLARELGGSTSDPEKVIRSPKFRELEQTAMLLEQTAKALLPPDPVPQPGPDLQPQHVDHGGGQRHLRRLMTSEDLKVKLGTRDATGKLVAKKEVRKGWFGFVINKRYKKLLGGLDAYQQKLASTSMRQTPHSRWRQAAEFKGMLDDLQTKVDDYARAHPDRAQAMQALTTQIEQERALLDDVVAHGRGFARQVRGQKVTNLDKLGFKDVRQKATWANATSLMAIKASVAGRTSDNEQRQGNVRGFGAGAINTVDLVTYANGDTMIFKPDKLMEGDSTGYQLQIAGIDLANPRTGARSVATSVLARHLGVSNLVPHTEFAEHGGRVGTVSALADGVSVGGHQFSYLAEMKDEYEEMSAGELANIGIRKETNVIVRKGGPVTNEGELEALRAIDQESNTRREAELRRLGIIKSENGTYARKDQVVTNPIEKKKFLAMSNEQLTEAGFAKHESAFVQSELVRVGLNTSDGALRKTLNDAQWLHAAAFHTDPHLGNMFAKLDDNGRVTGMSFIDNDTTFGKDARGDRLHYHANPGRPLRVAHEARELPSISAEFKRRLDDCDLDALRSDLEGLLSSEEIDATIDRIENLRRHASQLEEQDKVLEQDQWAGDAGKPSNDSLQYANKMSGGLGVTPSPALLVARAEARLKAPAVEDDE